MTGQREGFLGDILDKVKDIITPDDNTNPPPPPPAPAPTPVPQPQPPVTPQCCGPNPKFVDTGADLIAEGPKVHDADCPNHPDNLPEEVLA
jgi:hypothetical protein